MPEDPEAESPERLSKSPSRANDQASLQSLFAEAPIPIWEEDYSRVKKRLDKLQAEGVTDFPSYFRQHPEELTRLARMVKVLRLNRAARVSAGIPDDPDPPNLEAVFSPETYPVFQQQIMAMLKRETRYSGNSVTTAGDGRRRHYMLQWMVAPGHEDDYSRVTVTAIDVTGAKETEAALRQSEFKFASAFRSSPDALMISSMVDGRYIDVNDSFLRISGYTRDEVIGNRNLVEKIWEDPREYKDLLARLRREGGVKDFSVRFITRTGERVCISLSCEPLMLEKEPCLLSIARDVTQLEKARLALTESEEKYRRLFTSINEAIFVHPLEQEGFARFTEVNDVACERYGYSRDEFRKLTAGDISAPRDIQIRGGIEGRDKLRSEKQVVFEAEHITRAGKRFPVEISSSVFRLHGKEYVLSLVRDITERQRKKQAMEEWNRELEARVRERTSQLETANRDLESFSYSISHDLRAPLRHIEGFVRLLQSRLKDLGALETHYIERIVQASSRMHHMINDLLEFSRIGRSTLHCIAVDLDELVAEVCAALRPEPGKPEVEWRIDSLGSVCGDPQLLHTMFENLLGNAFKFSSLEESPLIEVSRSNQDGHACIRIKDNGIGFDPNYAHKLFDVFQRLHDDGQFSGTGIGLANVKRIVERHGGRITATGNIGKGAVFTVILPLNETPT